MMPADWAHAAYEAARRHDTEGVHAVLVELAGQGRDAMDTAMRAWIDRTRMVIAAAGAAPEPEYMRLEMAADGSSDVDLIDDLPREVAWAGRMFMAHVRGDQQTWEALWSTVPPTADTITDHVYVLLTTMTTTAAAAGCAENAGPDPAPRTVRGWIRAHPERAATRMAMAHLN
jgi:hypothetical protein